MDKILCSIATKGRYFSTLPMVIESIIYQTRKPDKLVIFDDNDEPQDLRNHFLYQHLFHILNVKGINWEWKYAEKKGQHHIHQMANTMGYDWVWRVDDDAIPEPNVLERLLYYAFDEVGAVGGSVITPPLPVNNDASKSTGKLENIQIEPNIQWGLIENTKEVEHLYCSFLYRAGVHDYNLGLSRVAHREETLFSNGLYQKGYKLLVIPSAITWHLKNPEGGIRSNQTMEMFEHDENIFKNIVNFKDKKIVVLTGGMGDHIVFKHILPEIENAEVFTCYPDIIPGRSIADAYALFGGIDQWNVYKKMADWNWTGSLEDAYRKLYL